VPRNEIFLASKFGFQRGGADHFYDPAYMREQCEISLYDLQTDVIDLYYFSHCDFGPNDEYFDDALANMRRFREEGKIRFIGLRIGIRADHEVHRSRRSRRRAAVPQRHQ